ncbi:hypothetical protein [Stackebrandtia nassauensis]|uniref:Uncharacterized protein n=1 Tax=Stackebrandtia nassauensis (strain DSM 44728 / CIP 108903 / NRRL B-16338 / NBRC 102104 / LLR-40K-21) TaxID=446470 RepID=D3Q5H7_STANL|nr:hypothetical protein [Stackebrandtia nassauensis]ADD46037.1 hypothetical protein Snas_6421 [Stackebrandtia nassauensis DSM 44728]
MSTHFEVPGQRDRPTSVSVAVYAQFAVGALGVIATVIGVIQTADMMGRVEKAITDTGSVNSADVDTVIGFASAVSYALIFASLLFALAVAIMGIFNLKGKNGARITTWVLAGLGLLCGVCGSISGAANSLGGNSSTANDELTKAMERALGDVPAWYNISNLAVTVLDVILYLAIIILLAIPASNDFFRKPKNNVDVMLPPEAYMDAPPPPPAPGTQPPPPPAAPEAQPPQQPRPDDDPGTPKP